MLFPAAPLVNCTFCQSRSVGRVKLNIVSSWSLDGLSRFPGTKARGLDPADENEGRSEYNARQRFCGEVSMRIRILAVAALVLGLVSTMSAASKGKIYLDPDDQFSAYFSAALQKKKVPVTITTDPKQADFTAQFQAKDQNGSLLKDVLSTLSGANYNNNSSNEVVMTIVNAKTKNVVFSYTCRKQSQNMDAASALASSVAECLAKHWKDTMK